jgi:hypothetical protein
MGASCLCHNCGGNNLCHGICWAVALVDTHSDHLIDSSEK